MPMTDFEAVILAAGQGKRLGSLGETQPKGLLEVAGESLIERSIEHLRRAGARKITIVVGYKAEMYVEKFSNHRDVMVVMNPHFASTGSFLSFMLGLSQTSRECLILDSDIIYETDGLEALIEIDSPNCILASGFSGSGDEVWVRMEDHRLTRLSKNCAQGCEPHGEFVGISRLSRKFINFAHSYHRMSNGRLDHSDYEDFIDKVCGREIIGVAYCPSLRWSEVDTSRQLQRARRLFDVGMNEV